jgi:hypothetical protein
MALRGTDPQFRDTVLSSMPSRGRRLVEGELNAGAFAPPQDIAKARKAIAEIVLGMASRNEIELGGPAGRRVMSADVDPEDQTEEPTDAGSGLGNGRKQPGGDQQDHRR